MLYTKLNEKMFEQTSTSTYLFAPARQCAPCLWRNYQFVLGEAGATIKEYLVPVFFAMQISICPAILIHFFSQKAALRQTGSLN